WLAANFFILPDPPDPPDLPVGFLRDLVLLQLFIEIAARRADHFGGLRDVPAVFAQLADEKRALRPFLELAQRARPRLSLVALGARLRRGRRAAARGGRTDALGQVGEVDRVAAG